MSKVLEFKRPGKETNFKIFGRSVAEGKIDQAAKVLRDLIKCDFKQAEKITHFYQQKFQESPHTIMQTMQLRTIIEQGQQNNALMQITELFGTSGPESLLIYEAMKKGITENGKSS